MLIKKYVKYIWISLKNLHKSGLLVPTSKFTIEKMVNGVVNHNTKLIVELGAGNGNITQAILKKMPKDARLFSFEISGECLEFLQEIEDDRLTVVNDSAENIRLYLNKHGFEQCDCIISTLPFSVFDEILQRTIIDEIKESLQVGGVIVQMRYFSIPVLRMLQMSFDEVSTKYSVLNLPPTFLHFCRDLTEITVKEGTVKRLVTKLRQQIMEN
jgi:phospholipid N-methyltransferase